MAGEGQGQLQVLVEIKSQTEGLDKANAELAEMRAQTDELSARAQAFMAAQSAADEKVGAAAAQKMEIETRQLQLAQMRLDLQTAIASGDETETAILRGQLGIREATLGVMRAQTLSSGMMKDILAQEAAGLALVEAQATETAASSLLMGANLNKAKGEAITLAREIATGSVNARTMGALLGSLGASLTVAGLVGYELYQVIAHAGDEANKLHDETAKETAEVVKQQHEWSELAGRVNDFGDVLRLADKIAPELQKMHQQSDAFRAQELGLWAKFIDSVAALWSAIPGAGFRPNQAALDAARNAASLLERQQLAAGNSAIDRGLASEAEYSRAKLGTASDAITIYTQKVEKLQTELDQIDRTKNAGEFSAWTQKANELQTAKDRLEEFRKTQEKANTESLDFVVKDRQARIDEAKLRGDDVAAAQHQLDVDKKISELSRSKADALKNGQVTQAEINALAEQEVTNSERAKEEKQGTRDAQKDINVLLREQQALIESIHQRQQLVDSNNFLGVDAKQALTIANIREELAALTAQIAADKALLAGGELDPQTYERIIGEIQKLQHQADLLGLKMRALQLPLKDELAQWVNSFGTSAHQIATTIEGTINATLQGTNQLLLDSAFRTGDWRKTLVGVEEQVASLFLTWLEQMALQKGAQLLGITTTTQAQVASGAEIAAAHAPAAAATSISSYGTAAIIGEVLAVAAIAAIMAALGGFEEGGYTRGRRGRVAGLVHGEEFVFDALTVDKLGVPFLEKLTKAAHGPDATVVIKADTSPAGLPYPPESYPGGHAPAGVPTYTGPVGYGPEPDILPGNLNWTGEPSVITSPSAPGGPIVDVGGGGGWSGPLSPGPAYGYVPFGGYGSPSLYPTTWSYQPGLGWVPAAQPVGTTTAWTPGNYHGPTSGAAPVYSEAGFRDSVRFAKGFARGGLVDNIPAWLTEGEFVMRDRVVDHYGPAMMEALNEMRIPRSHFADGGFVGGSGRGGSLPIVEPKIQVLNFTDKRALEDHLMKSGNMKSFVVETLSSRVVEFGRL